MNASSYRVEHLHRLEFSLSDNEGKRLELFVALGQRPELVGSRPSSWVEFIGSNVDHQVRTLDDAGTVAVVPISHCNTAESVSRWKSAYTLF